MMSLNLQFTLVSRLQGLIVLTQLTRILSSTGNSWKLKSSRFPFAVGGTGLGTYCCEIEKEQQCFLRGHVNFDIKLGVCVGVKRKFKKRSTCGILRGTRP